MVLMIYPSLSIKWQLLLRIYQIHYMKYMLSLQRQELFTWKTKQSNHFEKNIIRKLNVLFSMHFVMAHSVNNIIIDEISPI